MLDKTSIYDESRRRHALVNSRHGSLLCFLLFCLFSDRTRLTQAVNPPQGKQMAAVHFTTMTCRHSTVFEVKKGQIFENFSHCANRIVYAKIEGFRAFPYVFATAVKDYVL